MAGSSARRYYVMINASQAMATNAHRYAGSCLIRPVWAKSLKKDSVPVVDGVTFHSYHSNP